MATNGQMVTLSQPWRPPVLNRGVGRQGWLLPGFQKRPPAAPAPGGAGSPGLPGLVDTSLPSLPHCPWPAPSACLCPNALLLRRTPPLPWAHLNPGCSHRETPNSLLLKEPISQRGHIQSSGGLECWGDPIQPGALRDPICPSSPPGHQAAAAGRPGSPSSPRGSLGDPHSLPSQGWVPGSPGGTQAGGWALGDTFPQSGHRGPIRPFPRVLGENPGTPIKQ